MRYLVGAVVFLLCSCQVSKNTREPGQPIEYSLLLPGITLVETDPIGNLYVADDLDRLYKIDSTGARRYTITNNNLGAIHSIDAGNPFKIMVFYRDQQTVLMVDNTLSEIQRFQLADWQLKDVTAAALSPDNALWIYDGDRNQLVKLDDTGLALITSDPLDIILPVATRPDLILDGGTFLVIQEYGKAPFLFDDFGKYIQPLDFIPQYMSMDDSAIVFYDGVVKQYDYSARRFLPQPAFTIQPINDIFITRDKYYSFDRKGIYQLIRKS